MFGLFTAPATRTTSPTARTAKLRLEALEDRLAMSATVMNGDLYIYGGNGNDTVRVSYEYLNYRGYYKVVENGASTYISASRVTGGDVAFYGRDGDDYFKSTAGMKVYAWGQGGNDTLVGSYNNDFLDGGDGHDTLKAGADWGYNYLSGDGGDDTLYGSNGGDTLTGGSGRDHLFGFYGSDVLLGGSGQDRLYGGDGNDLLNGGIDGSADYMFGEAGADRFLEERYWTGTRWANRDYGDDFNYYAGDRYYL